AEHHLGRQVRAPGPWLNKQVEMVREPRSRILRVLVPDELKSVSFRKTRPKAMRLDQASDAGNLECPRAIYTAKATNELSGHETSGARFRLKATELKLLFAEGFHRESAKKKIMLVCVNHKADALRLNPEFAVPKIHRPGIELVQFRDVRRKERVPRMSANTYDNRHRR